MRRRIGFVPAVIAMLAIPGAVAAQACIGMPVGEAHNAVLAHVGFPQDAMFYGAAIRANMEGPLSFGAGYSMATMDNVEPKQHGLAVEANYEIPARAFSACPTVGVAYTTMSQDDSGVRTLSIPVGLGIGSRFELSPTMAILPYAVPQWTWTQATVEIAGEEFKGDDSVWGALFGATLDLQRFFVGGGVTWIDEDGVDPVFSLSAGMPF